MPTHREIVIVGGVAGGATCAARIRRLDENARIVVLDRGPYVSFANCGLPYYVGDVIRDDRKLLLATPQLFRERFNIEVRTRNEVLAIDRERRRVLVRKLETGREYEEPYDALVLAPGAAPVRPPLPGIDLPGIFTLRTVPDSREIRHWIETRAPRHAVIVGAGFIGLELAENLVHRGLEVTLVELASQIMPPLDGEVARLAQRKIEEHGIVVRLEDGVASFEQVPGGLLVRTKAGAQLPADLILLTMGVRPESKLARDAGLAIGERGGIRVDDEMRTSDPHIWAVGDAVEVRDRITGSWEVIPLAGPANRQGRVAADVICGRTSRFEGVQGTAVCGAFGITMALTGATEKTLQRAGITNYEVVWLHPGHHVGYYPGAKPIHLKMLFRREDGRVLGAQAVGEEGVERRIDVIAMAIQMGATVEDLEQAELCYAPQYGAAKDPVNVAGMIAANVFRGDAELAPLPATHPDHAFLLDVREPAEFAAGAVPGAVNIPLGELRQRLGELPHGREIHIICGVGQRAYYACRLLTQKGFRARNLSGGYQTWRAVTDVEARRSASVTSD